MFFAPLIVKHLTSNTTTIYTNVKTIGEEKVSVVDESTNPTSTEEDKELFKSIINNPDDTVLLDKLNASFIQSMTFKNIVKRSKKNNQSKVQMGRNGVSNQAAVTQKAAI